MNLKEIENKKSVEEPKEDNVDERILGSSQSGNSLSKIIVLVAGGVIGVVVLCVLFFFFLNKDTQQQESPSQSTSASTQTSSSESTSSSDTEQNNDLGTQDFTQDTNWSVSDELTNPDEFTKDLYNLTLNVDYTVSEISNVSDFVSYEKHRGTWGSGLELYWLDVDYKGRKYVIQVPFDYYKELDEIGIVPVKMEVLEIEQGVDTLYVISYMCLDEDTLKAVLKSQSK